MTSGLRFYLKPKAFESTSFKDDDLFVSVEDGEDFDNQGFLREVPYTSSSIDRSSIGSIPWADDAIKNNKYEWERVEKMLNGLEPLTNIEEDLRNEILDWQKKFPQLLTKSKYKMKNLSTDIGSLPSLDLTSEEEDEDIESNITLTRDLENVSITPTPSIRKLSEENSNNLCQLMDNFTLKSVPLKLSQRETNRKLINSRKCASSTSSYSRRSPPTPTQVPLINIATNRLRMPPIFNVLDSRRKFRNLGQNKNPSFVQLTQIQQAKSAAVVQEQKSRSRFNVGHRSAWHVPLVANRFFNNRNSIILPSLPSRQQAIQQYNTQLPTTSTTSEVGTLNTSKSGSLRSSLLRTNNNLTHHNLPIKRQLVQTSFVTNVSTQTNVSNTTTTSGRSISAAVQYPKITLNALYLPYSASKFHTFK